MDQKVAGLDAAQMAQMAQLIADAMKLGTVAAIEETKPRRTSIDEADFHKISSLNPAGERDRPRPGLKVPMFWGVLREGDERDKPPIPLYEIESAQTTYDEQILLNQLEAGSGELDVNGIVRPYEIYIDRDRHGVAQKLVIGFPKDQYEKANRNMLPPLARLAASLLTAQKAA